MPNGLGAAPKQKFCSFAKKLAIRGGGEAACRHPTGTPIDERRGSAYKHGLSHVMFQPRFPVRTEPGYGGKECTLPLTP
jgi:hypothetical protein